MGLDKNLTTLKPGDKVYVRRVDAKETDFDIHTLTVQAERLLKARGLTLPGLKLHMKASKRNLKDMTDKGFDVKCPKCGCRKIWLTEIIEASSEHFINNGVWDHSYDNNEYGNGLRVELRCDKCEHKWVGRKGVTIDAYRKDID